MKMSIWVKLLVITMGVLLSGSIGVNLANVDKQGEVIQAGIAEALTPIVRDVVKQENKTMMVGINDRFDVLELQSYSSDILKLSIGLEKIRTGKEVDELVLFWEENKWTSQLTAIKRVAESGKAREKLRESLYSDEVFRTLMLHAR